jgi:DNA-binding transcriptional regulator YiaG
MGMPNITQVLNDQVRRTARREIARQTRSTRRLTTQHRRDIAALKRQVAQLQKAVSFLEQQEKRRVAREPVPQEKEAVRFRPGGLKSHRMRLGLSADDYGRLIGVSGQSVYMWESGRTRPRKEQLSRIASLRRIGKREAHRRLELLDGRKG